MIGDLFCSDTGTLYVGKSETFNEWNGQLLRSRVVDTTSEDVNTRQARHVLPLRPERMLIKRPKP